MAIAERFQGANSIDAGSRSPYWGEHAARYVFSLPYVEDERVLDIACGTGYGIAILRRYARFVAGVDIDPDAIRSAKAECGNSAGVMMADAVRLPFADETFGVVTSFETLEHLHARREFLAELRRILKPDGTLLLSTPNALYSGAVNGRSENPFHVHEYTPGELRSELEAHFSIEQMLGQALMPDTGTPPFYEAQRRLPKDLATQIRLFGWRVFNKIPFKARETLSKIIWGKPFYPAEMDYNFDVHTADEAVTLVAVCRKN